MVILQALLELITDLLSFFPPAFVVFFISMIPVLEHRAGIPLGILHFGMPWWEAYSIAVLGNMVPMPLILKYLDPVENFLRKYRTWERFFDSLYKNAFRRAKSRMTKYRDEILISFIAVPIPMTGGWHGALIAFLFDIKIRKALLIILAGLIISGGIVTALSVFLPEVVN